MTVDTIRPSEYVLTCYRCGDQSEPRPTAGEARRRGKRLGWGRSYPRGRGEVFVCPRCKGQRWTPVPIVETGAHPVEAWSFSYDTGGQRGWMTLVRDGEEGDEWMMVCEGLTSTWSSKDLAVYLWEDADDATEPDEYRAMIRSAAEVVERSIERRQWINALLACLRSA